MKGLDTCTIIVILEKFYNLNRLGQLLCVSKNKKKKEKKTKEPEVSKSETEIKKGRIAGCAAVSLPLRLRLRLPSSRIRFPSPSKEPARTMTSSSSPSRKVPDSPPRNPSDSPPVERLGGVFSVSIRLTIRSIRFRLCRRWARSLAIGCRRSSPSGSSAPPLGSSTRSPITSKGAVFLTASPAIPHLLCFPVFSYLFSDFFLWPCLLLLDWWVQPFKNLFFHWYMLLIFRGFLWS